MKQTSDGGFSRWCEWTTTLLHDTRPLAHRVPVRRGSRDGYPGGGAEVHGGGVGHAAADTVGEARGPSGHHATTSRVPAPATDELSRARRDEGPGRSGRRQGSLVFASQMTRLDSSCFQSAVHQPVALEKALVFTSVKPQESSEYVCELDSPGGRLARRVASQLPPLRATATAGIRRWVGGVDVR